MSRTIQTKASPGISEEERTLKNTSAGKLILTRYRDRRCVLLLQNDRLTAAAFPEDSKVGAVYIAKVRKVVKNIEACFVEIAEGELCFLSLKEAAYPLLLNRRYDGRILEGDELSVQLVRDAQKTKQASVTAHISLANDYFALAFGPEHVGFSAKLQKEQKQLLGDILTANKIMVNGKLSQDFFTEKTAYTMPSIGLIVRTRAAKLLEEAADAASSAVVLQFQHLAEACNLFLRDAAHRTCFSCLKKTDSISIPDNFVAWDEYSELVTDEEALYAPLKEYALNHLPGKEVRLYKDEMFPLKKLYSLESKLETALRERVWLKSGGYLVIQPTEALTVIDVNSGKYEAKNKMGEKSALKINREAAEEIAIQLRVRNLSGIILVDFINMESEACREEITSYMKSLVKKDRVRTTVVDMTPLGLLEITRKKITKPLYEQFQAIKDC